ncbi:HAMP domain-containing sensor histidine kinase [Mucilaginibacter puniceus]
MLALLTTMLLLTAIIARETYTPQNSLNQSAKLLEDNLHKKEVLVNSKIGTPADLKKLQTLSTDNGYALDFMREMTTNNSIWVLAFNNKNLIFWSGIKLMPPNIDAIKNGSSFYKTNNGYYEVIKKTEGPFSILFFILVKNSFSYQNQYLQNTFIPDLFNDKSIEIADFTDNRVYQIHDVNHKYLFSVKVNPNEINHRFFYFELTFWVLAFIALCLLVHNIAGYISRKGYVLSSVLFVALFIIALRFVNRYYHWPDLLQQLEIFKPQIYGSKYINATLGDFCINISLLSWFATFLFKQRNRLIKVPPGKTGSYVLYIVCVSILLASLTALLRTFFNLVYNSQINFDVNNVLNLSGFSVVGILLLCFSFLIFFLFTETVLTISKRLTIPLNHQLAIFITIVFLTTIIYAYYWEFTLVYCFWAIIVLIRGYSYRYNNRSLSSGMFAVIILLYAFISSVMLNHFESIKEQDSRIQLANRLKKEDDPKAEELFKKIEKKIIDDKDVINSFKGKNFNIIFLKNWLQKLYFDDYLSKYDFKVHVFDSNDQTISKDKDIRLNDFKDMVLFSSFKVSDNFYRENSTFGSQNYFAILPIADKEQSLGVIVVDLQSRSIQIADAFPDLLIDGNGQQEDVFKDYSYAFYSDNKLMAQHGNFVYNLINTDFKGTTGKYVFTTTDISNPQWYRPFARYSHLVYKTSDRNLIVLSRQENAVLYDIASLTFFFVVMLVFSVIVILIRWSWIRIKVLSVTDNRIKWNFRINFDKVLYKTRIQFSMVFAVVITLIMVAIITYISISTQYQNQQDKAIRDKINRIAGSFEDGLIDKFTGKITEQDQIDFEALADSYSTDLSLFNRNGVLLITTQPKIYESDLLIRRMNARAFVNLNRMQRSEFVNDEKIAGLNYKAAYSPLKNTRGDVIAYLQLPYFSNQADYQDRIGSLLNIMFNIYALVFIAIALFAVFIARQITYPLNFIQASLSKIIYGKKNEPIKWERDDEIGALVKEYNNMIAALEESAGKLAQSERESAWREMAKQVAHEIKNPLTPLKLGLQLLDKSWKDKDPKFDQKFERFSKSFVEQIESLSSIASEFSAFAKMPDTRLERINIFDMLNQAVTIFKQMDNLKIIYHPAAEPFYIFADKDQLLRCFNNLLKNAIEATPEDRAGIIEITHTITDKNILLTIKDNGNGIPEKTREKIFEPNFTTKSSGTGLGLAFVKNSIENAGGKVWFETVTGVGTTFYLSLPAANRES